jgi:aspartate carbamoyltransferase catalytic subunit
LGGGVISTADAKSTSSFVKGETIADTVRTVENYCDIIVIRNPLEGAARIAAEYASVPVINAGDGAHQHPTQALMDLYTVRRERGRIDGLKVALCGDLKYGRTVHSLAYLLSMFGAEITLVAPKQLAYPREIREKQEGQFRARFTEKQNLADALDSDVIYMTRVQKERFPDPLEYERVRGSCLLTKELMQSAKKDCIVMHPLPRVDEIDYEIDRDPRAAYFKQAGYGVPVRMALISYLLGLKA